MVSRDRGAGYGQLTFVVTVGEPCARVWPFLHLLAPDCCRCHHGWKPPDLREVGPGRRAPPHGPALGPALEHRYGRKLALAGPLVDRVAWTDADELAQQLANFAEIRAWLQGLHKAEHVSPRCGAARVPPALPSCVILRRYLRQFLVLSALSSCQVGGSRSSSAEQLTARSCSSSSSCPLIFRHSSSRNACQRPRAGRGTRTRAVRERQRRTLVARLALAVAASFLSSSLPSAERVAGFGANGELRPLLFDRLPEWY